jgi:oxygen-independent coproporphyrinogen-3 oxidase
MTDLAPDSELLRRYDVAGPRYTSYPTAPNFHAFTPADHRRAVERANAATPDAPLSLYVHAPFCANPCFYCGCTRVITRDASLMSGYLQALLEEIRMQGDLFGRRRRVEQKKYGVGTPNYYSD